MKTGEMSRDHRVAFIDGYAGEGRNEGGDEDSPALLIRKAHQLASQRQIECYLVEQDKDRPASLRAMVEAEASDAVVEVFEGNVDDHLDDLLERTAGIALFVFLDPFGLMIPFDSMVKVLTSRPAGVATATEILINFTTMGLRRIAGHLTSDTPNDATWPGWTLSAVATVGGMNGCLTRPPRPPARTRRSQPRRPSLHAPSGCRGRPGRFPLLGLSSRHRRRRKDCVQAFRSFRSFAVWRAELGGCGFGVPTVV
jgi:hypothetical protein